mgnify:CR=1 FL=1
MSRVMVLGATGMLGSAVFRLAQDRGLDVVGTTTNLAHAPAGFGDALSLFDGSETTLSQLLADFGDTDYVVNCVGLIKHHIDESRPESRLKAIALNATLPHHLAQLAHRGGFRVIQIATDCVFSGLKGAYSELDPHDALDVYGKTKSLGEVPSEQLLHLRASIIGRELRTHRSLVDWALLQAPGARVTGYTDHRWNGVTTVAFARIALGLIGTGGWRPGTSHLTPANVLSKHELLQAVYRSFGREDIEVVPTVTGDPIDRSLVSVDQQLNEEFWRAGGYSTAPTIEELVNELRIEQGVL